MSMTKTSALALCIMVFAAPALADQIRLSAAMSEDVDKSSFMVAGNTGNGNRRLLQSGATNQEVSYCFPYYFIYAYTQNVYSTCLSIVKGSISGPASGNVDDECLTYLLPLYNTFTTSIYNNAVTSYNRCLFKYGYSITSSAASNIASWKIPAVTNRVPRIGKSDVAGDNLLKSLNALNSGN